MFWGRACKARVNVVALSRHFNRQRRNFSKLPQSFLLNQPLLTAINRAEFINR